MDMRNDLRIRTLTERFFDGETSLAEEQELYRLFREGDVPEDLKQYKELFAGFDSIRLPQQLEAGNRYCSICVGVVCHRHHASCQAKQ